MEKKWIKNTGVCPVPEGTLVDVLYANGKKNKHVKALVSHDAGGSLPQMAYDWSLSDYHREYEITAYRVCEVVEDLALAVLKKVLAGWDALPPGHHTPSQIQRWILDDMAPAIKEAKEFVKDK